MRLWIKASLWAAGIAIAVAAGCGPSAPCDQRGSCDQCLICAEDGPCKEAYEACLQIPDCVPFGTCVDDCSGDMSCEQKCAQTYPAGVESAQSLKACLLCDQCSKPCETAAADCSK